MISPAQSHTNDIMTLITDVDLSVLTEEVLETVFAGYSFQKSATSQVYGAPTTKSDVPPIAVIVDINKSDNYVFRTQPGAWRRVLMNLFGNALKYTPLGFTKVKLEVVPSSNPRDEQSEFRLTVIDSGIGMSEDYINNRLFHSFAQENPLSQGTGLGLSIVKQIIESLGGDIEVRSQKNQGTKFIVCCPLKPSMLSPADSPSNIDREFSAIRRRTKMMTVSFVGFETEGDYFPVKSPKNRNATRLKLKALENLCTDWFGMRILKNQKDTSGIHDPDVIVATESGARRLREQQNEKGGVASMAPAIVLCQGAASAHASPAKSARERVFECISQPCGPHKLAKALSSCLDRNEHRLMMRSIQTEPRLPSAEDLTFKENTTPVSPTSIGAMFASSPPSSSYLQDARPPLTPYLSAPAIPATSSSPSKSMRPLTPRPLNCLAADDNPINLRLLRTFIHKLHHAYGLATNGREAVEAYVAAASNPSKRFDVILMDINMPEMDGLEATRQIRAHERDLGLKPVTIIALTGVASSEAQQEAHVSGVNLFLIKPVRLGELETVLNGVVVADTQEKGVEDQGMGVPVGPELSIRSKADIGKERGKEVDEKKDQEGGDDLDRRNIKTTSP
jgi:CheY-like chemotaxis protein